MEKRKPNYAKTSSQVYLLLGISWPNMATTSITKARERLTYAIKRLGRCRRWAEEAEEAEEAGEAGEAGWAGAGWWPLPPQDRPVILRVSDDQDSQTVFVQEEATHSSILRSGLVPFASGVRNGFRGKALGSVPQECTYALISKILLATQTSADRFNHQLAKYA